MHENVYAGGFLFHPDSEQILLQQINSISGISSPWELMGCISNDKDDPEKVFIKNIYSLLKIKLETVYPIYSYNKEITSGNRHIFYSEIINKPIFLSKNNLSFAWFTFKEIPKLKASDQTKHDIVVGQRVIEAATRKRLGLQSF